MIVLLGMEAHEYDERGQNVINVVPRAPLLLEVCDAIDGEDIVSILEDLAFTYFQGSEKPSLLNMLGNPKNSDFYITHLAVEGKEYSIYDPVYCNIFEDIGVALSVYE
jgi:hypothetical protein